MPAIAGSWLSQSRKKFGHAGSQTFGDDPKTFERQILPAPFDGSHEIAVKPAGVGERLLRITSFFAQAPDSHAELNLKLVHFQ